MIYRIVRRAYSEYTNVATVTGSYLEALELAMRLQHTNRDGEYDVRKLDEANWTPPAGYVQSGFDYL